MNSVIIYGPQGCGKTINAELLAKKYNCTNIDDNDWHNNRTIADNTLVLTNVEPPYNNTKVPVIGYEEAMKGIEDQMQN